MSSFLPTFLGALLILPAEAVGQTGGDGATFFSRVDEDTLQYEYTVTDPVTFTAPWSVAFPMQRTDEPRG